MRDTMTLHLQRCSRERTSCGSALLPSNRQRAAASGISDSRDTVRQSRIQTRSEPMLRVSRFCPEHFGRVRSAGPPARGQVACVTLSCERRQPRLTERSSRIRLADATAEETGQGPYRVGRVYTGVVSADGFVAACLSVSDSGGRFLRSWCRGAGGRTPAITARRASPATESKAESAPSIASCGRLDHLDRRIPISHFASPSSPDLASATWPRRRTP
jgi:hypothetical protein